MEKISDWDRVGKSIDSGKLVIIPTDTLYGISASVKIKEAVEKIYKIKKRSQGKPLIVLISSMKELGLFGIKPTKKQKEWLGAIWPGSFSVILDCFSNEFKFLHRGTYSLAFRFPNEEKLLNLIKKTGPIVSTSVNFEGEEPVGDFSLAKNMFDEDIEFFLEKEKLSMKHSTLFDMRGDAVRVIREGEGFSSAKEVLSL